MKKLLLFVLPILLFTSCAQFDNSTHGTTVTANGWDLVTDSAGPHTVQHLDTVYTVSPTWSQAWTWAGERNGRVWFWVGIVLIVAPLVTYGILTSRGNNSMSLLLLPAFAILVGGGITGASLEWEKWGMDQTIPKMQYDALMKDPGNLGAFWDTIRVK